MPEAAQQIKCFEIATWFLANRHTHVDLTPLTDAKELDVLLQLVRTRKYMTTTTMTTTAATIEPTTKTPVPIRTVSPCLLYGQGVFLGCFQSGDYRTPVKPGLDEKSALALFERAAELGYGPAIVNAAAYRLHGYGCAISPEKGIAWYRKGLEIKDATAATQMGILYLKGQLAPLVPKNYPQAVKHFMQAVEWGASAAATYHLACMVTHKQYTKATLTQAFEWMKCAAEAHHLDAMSSLGAMYYGGIGCTKDRTKALVWTSLAAASGSQDAAKNLLVMQASPD